MKSCRHNTVNKNVKDYEKKRTAQPRRNLRMSSTLSSEQINVMLLHPVGPSGS